MQKPIPASSAEPPWQRYLGASWSKEFDCWALVRAVYAEDLGIELPAAGIDPTDLRQVVRTLSTSGIRARFERVDRPRPWAVGEVLTVTGTPIHVGVCVETPDGLAYLNNRESVGVVCEPLRRLLTPITWWTHV